MLYRHVTMLFMVGFMYNERLCLELMFSVKDRVSLKVFLAGVSSCACVHLYMEM